MKNNFSGYKNLSRGKKEVSLILCMIFAVMFILPAVSAGNIIVKNRELNITDNFLVN